MADTPYPIPASLRRSAEMAGTGETEYGPFGDGWKIFDAADVVVETRPAAGPIAWAEADVTVTRTQPTARLSPFTVTFDAAIDAATVFRVSGRRLHSRQLAVTKGGAIHGPSLELELSKQSVVLQELHRDLTDFTINPSAAALAAAASAAAALASEAAAAASYDSFDDRYLGVKAADPATDNDGNALVAGMLYWNSTGSVLKVYTGAAWANVATYANFVGDSGAGGAAGLVPAPAAGDAAAGKFLAASGSFANPVNRVVKTADFSVNNGSGGTTLQSDAQLKFALAANEKATIQGRLLIQYPLASSGIKIGLTGPAAPTEIISLSVRGPAGVSSSVAAYGLIYEEVVGGASSAIPQVFDVCLVVTNGANAGDIIIQIAQSTAHASAVVLKKRSRLSKVVDT